MSVLNIIIDGMGRGFEWLATVQIGSVSLWQIIGATFILGALITGLLNVVKNSVGSGIGYYQKETKKAELRAARAKAKEAKKGNSGYYRRPYRKP